MVQNSKSHVSFGFQSNKNPKSSPTKHFSLDKLQSSIHLKISTASQNKITSQLDFKRDATKMVVKQLDIENPLSRSNSTRSVRRKKKKGIVRKRSDSKYPISNYCNDCREWFLKNVSILKDISEELIGKIVDIMIEKHYAANQIIKRQNSKFTNVFIVAKGYVKLTKRNLAFEILSADSENELKEENDEDEEFLGYLSRGDWFGDILSDEQSKSPYTVTAIGTDGVECIILEKDAYHQLIKDANNDINNDTREKRNQTTVKRLQQYSHLSLKDLVLLGSLGSGGFGRVELVRINKDDSKTFALKQMRKTRIVEAKQQDHVMHERNILLQVDSDFIVRLYRTFKDRKYLYMMMEVCLGGELWSILREKNRFNDLEAQFYSGCVIAALSYLHSRQIVYRDLKPENLMLDHRGYCKLTDFGFAKRIGSGRRTWTFCGTPDYVAPEIILYSGHDVAADFWSLGILVYELLSGRPPFIASTISKTYDLVLIGMDTVEFPRYISKEAQNLIKKLCRSNPSERMGYGVEGLIKCFKHSWFSNFNSDELLNQSMNPPIIPQVGSPTDRGNFGNVKPESDDEPDDDVSGWDRDF